jgi:general secretion pathway protein N
MTRLLPIYVVVLLPLVPAAAVAADATPPPAQTEAPVAPANPLAAQTLDRLSATRERPLFSPTRRPPPPPPEIVRGPEPPPPPAPPPNVALFGIVMDGEEARAVVRAGPANQVVRVRIGDDVGGWKVSQIEGRKLVLSLDGRLATFTLFNSENGNRAPANNQRIDQTSDGTPAAPAAEVAEKPPQDQSQQNDPRQNLAQPQSPRRHRRGRQ